MENRLIIVEINELLNGGENPGYKAELYEDMITNKYIKVHQLIYHVGLSGGTFIVKLNYDRGAFNYTYDQEYQMD